MRIRYRFVLPLLVVAFGLSPASVFAQEHIPPPDPRPSPLAMTRAMVGDSYVKVTYSSPRMKEREIFGSLVPYGSVWRTGANEATEITLTAPIRFGGEELAAGTYSLFSIPNEDAWTIIVNSAVNQWGAFSHNPDHDVLRVDVPTEALDESYEAVTIGFEGDDNPSGLYIIWNQTRVTIPLAAL